MLKVVILLWLEESRWAGEGGSFGQYFIACNISWIEREDQA